MDQVPGKKLQADASALDVTYCQPCSQDGETLPAEAYCTVCKEFMCSNCTSVHKKQRMSKSHTLLEKSNMPTTMQDFTIKEESTQPCDIHPEERIKYFCPTHQTLNCGHCSVLDHQSCKQQIISEIAKVFKEGQGYDTIKQVIVKLLKDIDACASDVNVNIKLVEDLGEQEIAKIRNYRDQINKFFDERENELLKNIAQMQNMDEILLESLKSKCNTLKIEVNKIKTKLEAQENNTCQLFVEAELAKNMLKRLQSTLADLNMVNFIHQYQLKKDFDTEYLLRSKTGLGTVEMASANSLDQRCERASSTTKDKDDKNNTTDDPSSNVQAVGDEKTSSAANADISIQAVVHITAAETTNNHSANTETVPLFAKPKQKKQAIVSTDLTSLKYTPAKDILVSTQFYTRNCPLSDMLLLPGDRLLLAECITHTVKLIDINTSNLVANVSVPTGIWGMCLLPRDRVAVSLTDSIQFLETRGQLSLGKSIAVDGDCYGVGYDNNSLIVSYKTGRVEKIDMEGRVLNKVSKRMFSGSPFKKPFYLTVVNEGPTKAIYVSDCEKNTITSLDINLNILETFHDPALKEPTGITAVGNQLLICGLKSNNIMCLDLPSGRMTQLLCEKEGIELPRSVCYNQQQNKLYVTVDLEIGDVDSYVKVYKTT
ncbi:uncharacterized protein LOC128220241 isoform X2 [Mya arenaria]|uniref:uncharacterized protein LOC128220241 isoform X2 n=1 Tax=Mya arenaria TaxID=6604 RepID=UPI0022E42DD6|nr:uncharacterized protein LOC128220241 isoform X2 [Mya arenaria]